MLEEKGLIFRTKLQFNGEGEVFMSEVINFQEFAGGALAEQLNTELQKVLDNIYDPNTEPKKTRKLTLTLTFKPSENRGVSDVGIVSKSTLAPVKAVKTNIIIDKDLDTGKVVAAEIGKQIKGQISIDEVEEDEKESNVVDLKKVK